MTGSPLRAVLRHLGQVRLPGDEESGDADLLGRFVHGGDESAFAELLRRHGAMVLGTCRRLLRHEQDAEDAFQATFLVLARRAAAVRCRGSLGAWLHQVAFHLALKARARRQRRLLLEQAAVMSDSLDAFEDLTQRDLRPVLDEELARLPEKYRLPIVLCYLEGHTNEQAARRLGCTKGTVSGRLARARELLRGRLARRGIALSAPALAPLLAPVNTAAAVPPLLATRTTHVAGLVASGSAGAMAPEVAALACGSLRAAVGSRALRGILVLLLAGLSASGLGWLLADPPEAPPAPARADLPAAAPETLPQGALRRLGSTRFRHGHGVTCVAVSPDGRLVATSSNDHAVRLWDATTGQLVRLLGETANRAKPFEAARWIRHVAFSPDGKTLAVGLQLRPEIRLFDVATGQSGLTFAAHPGGLRWLEYSPDGKFLVSTGEDRLLRLWDAKNGNEIRSMAGDRWGSYFVRFSPDGRLLASGGEREGIVRLWDTATGKELRQLEGHVGEVGCAAFAPDGKTLATGGGTGADGAKDWTIRLWDVAAGRELRRLPGYIGQPRTVAFSSDGKFLASAGTSAEVQVHQLATGALVFRSRGHQGEVRSLAFTPDSSVLLSGSFDCTVRRWSPTTGKELGPIGLPGTCSALCYSADGQTLFTATRQGTLHRWDPATGQARQSLMTGHVRGQAVALSPDRRTVAAGTWEGPVRLVDAATGAELRVLRGHEKPSLAVAYSSDGRTLASAAGDGTVRLWDPTAGRELRRLNAAVDRGLAFSPTGQLLATCSAAADVTLWDAATGKEVRKLSTNGENISSPVAFSPNGRLVAVGTQTKHVHLWEVETGNRVQLLTGLTGYVMGVAFAADGRSVAAGGWMGVRVWEVATGRERRHFQGFEGDVFCLTFAPDGRTLVAGCGDTTALVWDLTGGRGDKVAALEPGAHERALRALSEADATAAYDALWMLAAAPDQTLPRLRAELRPVASVDAARIRRLVAELDDDSFDKREAAAKELEQLGEAAAPALRGALEGRPTAEVRRRVDGLLERLSGTTSSGERLRATRSLELLEQLDSPEARELFATLAKGASGAWLTEEAKAALARASARQPYPRWFP